MTCSSTGEPASARQRLRRAARARSSSTGWPARTRATRQPRAWAVSLDQEVERADDVAGPAAAIGVARPGQRRGPAPCRRAGRRRPRCRAATGQVAVAQSAAAARGSTRPCGRTGTARPRRSSSSAVGQRPRTRPRRSRRPGSRRHRVPERAGSGRASPSAALAGPDGQPVQRGRDLGRRDRAGGVHGQPGGPASDTLPLSRSSTSPRRARRRHRGVGERRVQLAVVRDERRRPRAARRRPGRDPAAGTAPRTAAA